VAVLREDKSIAGFERIAVVLSGGGALAAYQAGALAALDNAGFQPHWLAGTSTGAFNAAIVAGNAPRQRVAQLRNFWRRLTAFAADQPPPSVFTRAFRRLSWIRRDIVMSEHPFVVPARQDLPVIDTARLRSLLAEVIDFSRINSGKIRLSLGAVHLVTGAEIIFDNDRHIIGVDHVLASAALPAGLSPVSIDGELYGNGGVVAMTQLPALLDSASPADTLCFVIDCCDPASPGSPGLSRASQQIAAYRRRHDLRRIIGVLGDKIPAEMHRDPEIRFCLAQASHATMNLVHLVHESNAADLVGKVADFSPSAMARRWRAGERDMVASLGRSAWLTPPPRRVGVVVHELRGGAQIRSR
jgi:NTE family protein